MASVIRIDRYYKKLPDGASNKRFLDKNKKLQKVAEEIQSVKKHLQEIDTCIMLEIPLLDSSTLALYNALVESLELDINRIKERVK